MANQESPSPAAGGHRLDAGRQQLGAIYAEGMLRAAQAGGQVEPLLAEMEDLVREVLDRFPRFEAVLASAMVSPADKEQLLRRALGGRVSTLLLHSLLVIARHERLDCLRAIYAALKQAYLKLTGRVEVEVRTAVPLDGAAIELIQRQLHAALGREPLLEQKVDASLVGGLVLRVGDTVFDSSIAAQLRELRERMYRRCIHEIQSGRDRFCHPEGN